jgi:GGDEF domain-containing protein/tetratricopeptide (TPR) repeat protein
MGGAGRASAPPAASHPRPPLISPTLLADDFARQLSYDELVSTANATLPEGRTVLWSLLADGMETIRRELGDTRADALLRELTLFVRRNLRGTDAVAAIGDELLVLLDAAGLVTEAVAQRLLAAVRAHVFSGGASDRSLRLTLSIGIASVPANGTGIGELLEAARAGRIVAGRDALAFANDARSGTLEVERFVGRTEQLAQFTDYLDDMVRGVGHVVAIIGETGVGTSSLARTLEPEVRMRGGSLVVATCRENTQSAPYALWRDVLRAIRRLPVKSTRVWRELPSLDPSLERADGDTVRGRSKIRLLEELAEFLRLGAQQRPLVLHLEELQWIDAASWDALEHLIPLLESERILIFFSFRTGEEYDDALERWGRLVTRPRHHEMRLTRLTRDEVKQWLEAAMHGEEVGRDLLAYVYRHTEGNPLLLTHLLRDLAEEGHLVRGDARWQWSAVSALPAQVSLAELLERRIGRLSPAARTVLEAVAVLGREFDEELVRALTGLPGDAVTQGLTRLCASELLVPTFERVRGTLAIAHEEIARLTRAQIEPTRRAALHRAAARLLTLQPGISPSEVAAHYEAANAPAETHECAVRAADAAEALYENAAASSLLAWAERTAPSPEQLAAVRVRMASLAEDAGRYEEAEALCELALAWYESRGNQLQALRVKRTRLLGRMKRGLSARATQDALLLLEAEARAVGADAERGAILLLISLSHWRLGDPSSAQRVAAEALVIAEKLGDPLSIADACIRTAITLQFEPARARTLFRRALEISTEIGENVRRVRCFVNLGVLELYENNWDAARSAFGSAVDEARAAGLTELWALGSLNLGVTAARVGEYDDAAQYLGEALRLSAAVQNTEFQLYATYNLAHLERDRGRAREAADTYELVMALADRIGQAEVLEGARAACGLIRLESGREPEARHAAEQVALFLETRSDWFQGRELAEALLLRLYLLDDEQDRAIDAFGRVLTLAHPTDIYAAAWLTAEFGAELRPFAGEMVQAAIERYATRPEVLGNPKIRDRLAVLLVDSKSTIDRIGRVR